MKTEIYKEEVKIPSIRDFSISYPQYGNFAASGGNIIFNKIMTPYSFIIGKVCTNINLPAVTGIANKISDDIEHLIGKSYFNFTKQFIGAVMCSLMEANGFEKTGRKKAVPHYLFTKGELYKKNKITQ